MSNPIQSIVIVAWRKGFVAHLRFKDPKDDADLSASKKYFIDMAIDRYVQRKFGW